MAAKERFLVTGAAGALGAWVIKLLIDANTEVVALGPAAEDRRLRLIVDPVQLAQLRRVDTTPADVEKLRAAMSDITHVVHTDTTTDEDCRTEPVRAAEESIGGLVNVLESAREAGVVGLAFESSMAVFASSSDLIDATTRPNPTSLLGCYHLAKELFAETSFLETGLSSIGLRSNLIYGPGQDQGALGEATRAIASTVGDEPYSLVHEGLADFQFVSDVAQALITAARASTGDHKVLNLRGQPATMAAFVQTVAASTGANSLTAGSTKFPLPVAVQDSAMIRTLGLLETPLDVGIRATLETLRWAPQDLYS